MKTLLGSLILAFALPAAAGPDFHTPTPRGSSLSASEGTRSILPEDVVVFAHDSARLTEASQAQVAAAARWLAAYPRARLVVEGHADVSGGAEYNHELAERRAHAVRDQLVRAGIAIDRVIVVVYGKALADPRGNPLDRRAVLYASELPVRAAVRAALARPEVWSAMWTEGDASFRETRGTRAIGAVARR
jgi:hypothetical protein